MESLAARLLYGRDPGTLRHCLFTCAMDSRRLVVWISTGILGFQPASVDCVKAQARLGRGTAYAGSRPMRAGQ